MSLKYKNQQTISVDLVSTLFILKATDGEIFQTKGYSTTGIGSNVYSGTENTGWVAK